MQTVSKDPKPSTCGVLFEPGEVEAAKAECQDCAALAWLDVVLESEQVPSTEHDSKDPVSKLET